MMQVANVETISTTNRYMDSERNSATEQLQSAFTAVNSRSPSNGSNPGNQVAEKVNGSELLYREPQNSPPKRKEGSIETSSHQLDEQHGQKKQRVSDAQDRAPAGQPPPEALDRGPPSEGESLHSSNEGAWGMHERNGSMTSDAHLAEVLSNNITGQHIAPSESGHDHRYPLDPSHPQGYGDSPVHMHTPAGMTATQYQKQRKRNFSNRTKTGCLTCRERKKKCDEGRPQCNNCQRGGFYCKGYVPTATQSFKASLIRDQQPLQAKNGYYDSNYRYNLPNPIFDPPQPDSTRPPDSARPPESTRPAPPADTREQPRTVAPPPQDHSARPGYAQQQWSEQGAPVQPYGREREAPARPDYQPVAPLREVASHQKAISHPPPAPVHPSHTQHNQHNSQHNAHNRTLSHQGTAANPPASTYNINQPLFRDHQRYMAQSALEQQNINTDHLSEKQKMIKGLPFNRRDPKLKQERYDCSQAIYRFNKNAIEPGNLSEPARREQFRQILEGSNSDGSPQTRKRRSISPHNERVVGHLGLRVEVDAPFSCEYGYNISIGDDVEIGPSCRIMDSCHVEIGARCIIGPDVAILTLDGDHHGEMRAGQKRGSKAKRVVIGDDVFIGARAIILPGISIHKGATIGAGCVVSRDVTSPVTVVSGIPPRYPRTHFNYIQTVPQQPMSM